MSNRIAKPSEDPNLDSTLGMGSSSGSLKKGSAVFRPGTYKIPFIPTVAGAPYGPGVGETTLTGIQVKALYDGTDKEVAEILLGQDTGEGPLSPTFRRGLKDILLAAGFLNKKEYVPTAEFGSADYAAMRDFLREANYLGGYNWREALGIVTDRLASQSSGGAASSTYTQYNISNEQDAEIIVDAALTNFLGRGATESEKATLSKALRKYEQETPTVTTTTRGAGGTVGTTVSGVSAAGRQQAIRDALSQGQEREMRGVFNTELGNLFTNLLRNA